MKRTAKILVILSMVCIGATELANAASWSPVQEEREERYDKAARGILEKGSVACLFQSGTADVKREIRVNDILTVYRENKDHHLQEVGKVKVRSYVGEDYLKGEVVEGELMPGDIAKKGEVASLVISSSDKCK